MMHAPWLRVRVRGKLSLAFLVLALVGGLTSGLGLFFVERVNQALELLTRTTMPTAEIASDLQDDSQRMQIAVLELRGVRTEAGIAQQEAELSSLFEQSATKLDKLRSLASASRLDVSVVQAVASLGEVRSRLRQIVAAHKAELRASSDASARAGELDDVLQRARAATAEFVSAAENTISQRENEAKTLLSAGGSAADLEDLIARTFNENLPILNRAYRLTRLLGELQGRVYAHLAERDDRVLGASEVAIQKLITGLQTSTRVLSVRVRQEWLTSQFHSVADLLRDLELIITAEKGIFGMHREALAASARAESLRAGLIRAERVYEQEVNRVEQAAHVLNEAAQAQAQRDVLHARWGTIGGLTGGGVLAVAFAAWFARRVVAREDLLGQQEREHAKIQQQSARFDLALTSMSQGLCMFDESKRLIVMNRQYADMYALPAELKQTSTPFGLIVAHEAAASGWRSDLCDQFYRDPEGVLASGGKVAFVHDLADGRAIQVLIALVPGGGWICTHDDVTERKRSEAQIIHMAHHDALTGLPNRVLLREHLSRVLPRMVDGEQLAVLCLDLDGFKSVNDTYGHPAGDELLRAVARRLQDNTRRGDLVARLGGDEFAIVQAESEQPLHAASLSARLIEAIKEPFEVLGQKVQIGTSIGIALANQRAVAIDELLRSADIALYRAKGEGRGTSRFFEATMDVEIQRRRNLEADLRSAVANEQFELHYQPLVDAETQVLTGLEALVRWRHPDRGLVAPAEFIGLAEEIGLIRPLGAWVLTRACADAATWPKHVKVAVNLSPVQISSGGLLDEVQRAFTTSGLDPQRLELEITESVLLQNSDATLDVLHQLRALGVSIAMDDFGTGYSSLSYLRRFPFDKIKIDQSFVRHIDEDSLEIIRAVVGLGKALKMQVLAEGVESADQLGTLQREGCDQLQGYFFSRPRPAAEVTQIIADWANGTNQPLKHFGRALDEAA